MEIIKVCKNHGELTSENVYHFKSNKIPQCKKCVLDRCKKWKEKNPEKRKEVLKKYNNSERRKNLYKKYYQENKLKMYKKSLIWNSKNVEKVKACKKRYEKKAKEQLLTPYVVRRIIDKSALKHKDIPESLVEAKRMHLKLKRKLWSIKNENN